MRYDQGESMTSTVLADDMRGRIGQVEDVEGSHLFAGGGGSTGPTNLFLPLKLYPNPSIDPAFCPETQNSLHSLYPSQAPQDKSGHCSPAIPATNVAPHARDFRPRAEAGGVDIRLVRFLH